MSADKVVAKGNPNLDYLAINRATYDQLAEQYAQRIAPDTAGDRELMSPFFKFISTHFQDRRPLELLDIGCGNGLNLRMMIEFGHSATGVELSPNMATLARDTAPAARIIVGNFLTSTLSDNYYHGIFAKAIFHLFPKCHASEFLRLVHRALHVKGIFYITTTAEETAGEGYVRKYDYAGAPIRFRARWTEAELRETLSKNGFAILNQSFDTEDSRAKTWINFWTTKE